MKNEIDDLTDQIVNDGKKLIKRLLQLSYYLGKNYYLGKEGDLNDFDGLADFFQFLSNYFILKMIEAIEDSSKKIRKFNSSQDLYQKFFSDKDAST